MRLWILANEPPSTEDAAYLIGRLTSRSSAVYLTHVAETDHRPPDPPAAVDAMFNYSFNTGESYLRALDDLAARLGVVIVNSGEAALAACDKRRYIESFTGMIPKTWVVATLNEIIRLQDDVADEIVLKDPHGKHGKGIIRFAGEQDSPAAAALLESMPAKQLVAQVLCRGFMQGDKRIIVHRRPAGGFEVAAWFARKPAPGGWISNYRAGGSILHCELEDDERDLVLRVAEAAQLDYVGIDVGREADRPLLIETNAYTGGHINFDIDHRAHSGDGLANLVAQLAAEGSRSRQIRTD